MIGIDEVGRGAWAGPLLVVAARLKEHAQFPEGLTDSKLMSKQQRENMFEQLLLSCEFGEGWVSAEDIDKKGLAASLRVAAANAFATLENREREEVVIDGTVNFLEDVHDRVRTLVKAELSEPSVAAASVYAKVVRDRYMQKLHYTNPGYGFNAHVGYGTLRHREALAKHGLTKYHRKSFKPISGLNVVL